MCVIKHGICFILIDLFINENGVIFLSLSCLFNFLKFIDFLAILGGVPVFILPKLNPYFLNVFERPYVAFSPTLPAGIFLSPI